MTDFLSGHRLVVYLLMIENLLKMEMKYSPRVVCILELIRRTDDKRKQKQMEKHHIRITRAITNQAVVTMSVSMDIVLIKCANPLIATAFSKANFFTNLLIALIVAVPLILKIVLIRLPVTF